jgi:hypothetical protein
MSAGIYDRAMQALRDFAFVPGASVWYSFNFAEGIKPGGTA